jgi:hypothetical protein
MPVGETLDVCLVDDGLVVGDARRPVVGPVEERVDHHALAHVRRGVVVVALVRVAELVAEQRLVPVHLAGHGLGVRVEQQLVRVAAQPLTRVVGAVDAVAVLLAGHHAGHVAVVDEPVHLGEPDPGLGAVVVEQAELDLLGDLGEQREVGPRAVVRGSEGIGAAWPRRHKTSLTVGPPVRPALRAA